MILFYGCSKYDGALSNKASKIAEISLPPSLEAKLPDNFTLEKTKSALLEYINYRMWYYPSKIEENFSEDHFDKYIGKPMDVEIRVYNDNADKSVYAHTSIGHLLVFDSIGEFVYCDGQVKEGSYKWPKENSYEVVEKYQIILPEPRKPNYGTSPRKDKMLTGFESTIRSACEEYYSYKGSDGEDWENVDVYIADFYEYEMGTHAWFVKQDGSIANFPASFEEDENGDIKVIGLKGYTLPNKDEIIPFAKHLFEKDITDAIVHFRCNTE